MHLTNEGYIQRWQSEDPPLSCKLTDSGEGRSRLIQTNSMLASKVKHADRGTPAFMSPELLIPELRPADAIMQDLMESDIWALDMIMYVLANPDIAYPYYADIEARKPSAPFSNPHEILELLMQQKVRPRCSIKYQSNHATVWAEVCTLYNACTSYEHNSRYKCIDKVKNLLEKLHEARKYECIIRNLDIHQGTAVEGADHPLAQKATAFGFEDAETVANDGTNWCIFLALRIASKVITKTSCVANSSCFLRDRLADIARKVIWVYPVLLNGKRDDFSGCEIMKAYGMMRNNGHIRKDFVITEELPYGGGYMDCENLMRPQEQMLMPCQKNENFCAVFTCEPYSLQVGKWHTQIFIADTHPVPESVGGSGNAHVATCLRNRNRSFVCKRSPMDT
eukprot:gene15496-17073_t